ncbi:hypothetical protein HO928_04330 [Streptococcus suis]|nr:hypothetical protein [Streptococcus suis]
MLQNWIKKHGNLFALGVFIVFALLLQLPHLLTRGMVTGADVLFHYNRFYDTAMQIKEGNFSFFMSLYGYQQSGRIVNALYGPLFAYFQGLLVLVSGTWFRYQIVSNALLGVLSASSLYLLMKEVKVRYGLSLLLSLFFMTTYSIQYWWVTQGLTSWGVALFPLCLIPAIRFLRTGKVLIFLMAGAVGLMLQVHVLSTLFLIIVYGLIFLVGWLSSEQKWKIIGQVFLSVGIFLLLTVNVWLPILSLNGSNHLLQPFVNKSFVKDSVTWVHTHFLYYPYSLPVLFAVFMGFLIKKGKQLPRLTATLSVVYLIFLVLSTNLFPWQFLAGKEIGLVELLQFPYRFFLYANVLLLVALGLLLSQFAKERYKTFLGLVAVSTVVGMGFIWKESYQEIRNHYFTESFLQERLHTTLYGSAEEIRQSFHSTDMGEFLYLAQKSTPDYVPNLSKEPGMPPKEVLGSFYNQYRDQIILPNANFDKEVKGESLVVSWTSQTSGSQSVPIVVYKDSQLALNGQSLTKEDMSLSAMGVPTVISKPGKNQLVLTYKPQWWLLPSLAISLLGWVLWLIYYFIKHRKSPSS